MRQPDSPETGGDGAAVESAALVRLNYDPAVDDRALFEAHRSWARCHAAPHYPSSDTELLSDDPERPLRVGYVSGDLRRHPVAFFVEPILRSHDRSQVTPVCYDTVGLEDDMNAHLRSLVPDWWKASGWSDEALAERIRADRIDILVDLAGHTARNRLLVFARKPAPIQVTGIGYVTTSGLETMDYRLTDALCDPGRGEDRYYSERLWRLETGFNCYAPPRGLPEPGSPPCFENSRLTFGCFNNLDKIAEPVIDTWSEILHDLPNARLLMKTKTLGEPAVREQLLAAFASRGIVAERLELRDWSETLAEHFAAYREVDISLDPFPYNGTTTTCESLMMGVPVVALRGGRHASRVSFSLLARLGLEGLTAQDSETYVERAVALASRPDALAKLRAGLRRRLATSPLCDAARYTRTLEAAYRGMWQRRCTAAAAA